jgi:hypothetical protein
MPCAVWPARSPHLVDEGALAVGMIVAILLIVIMREGNLLNKTQHETNTVDHGVQSCRHGE